jgi:Zn-finger nucleic acid-binding protein
MICPACKNQTIVVERNRIELDYCTYCGGLWFDSGEIELLLESLSMDACSTFIHDILTGTEARSREKLRRCPDCAQKMRKSTFGEEPGITLDICRQGDGLWFDAGELDELLRQLARKPVAGAECDRKVTEFLGEVFQAHDRP